MTATIPVPIWIVFVFVLLAVVWQVATTFQTRALRDLYKLYTVFREAGEVEEGYVCTNCGVRNWSISEDRPWCVGCGNMLFSPPSPYQQARETVSPPAGCDAPNQESET